MSVLVLKATDLLEVLFDEVLDLLDTAGLAPWRRRISASDCPLWVSVREISRPQQVVESANKKPNGKKV